MASISEKNIPISKKIAMFMIWIIISGLKLTTILIKKIFLTKISLSKIFNFPIFS